MAPTLCERLVGLVVKAYASRAVDQGSIPAFAVGIFPGQVTQMTVKKKTGTPTSTLPGA